jgi:hypothetical protein
MDFGKGGRLKEAFPLSSQQSSFSSLLGSF